MTNNGMGTNYYEVLEVSEDAPTHEILKAYQRAKATYNSDNPALYSMFTPDEAKELLRLVEEAYSILGNPSLRKTYDEARASGGSSPLMATPQMIPHAVAAASNADHGTSYSHPQPSVAPSPVSSAQTMNMSQESPAAGGTSASSSLPPGTGRTSLSTYKIDDGFETELKNATEFDGGLLQRARIYKNISIDRLSEATRISRPYLTAVETNDYKSLPAAVFTRGFVVQMARVLGLNETKVSASYIKMFKAGGGK